MSDRKAAAVLSEVITCLVWQETALETAFREARTMVRDTARRALKASAEQDFSHEQLSQPAQNYLRKCGLIDPEDITT